MAPSVAFLVMYELRGMNKESVESLYRNIVDVYDADIFVLCQRQFEDDEQRIALFDRKVVKAGLYTPRGDENTVGIVKRWQSLRQVADGNYVNDGNVNVYLNNAVYAEFLGELSESYDWFVMARTDIDILFPFPPPSVLADLPPGVYGFAPEYCKLWGGSGGGNIVHRDYILQYLTSYRDCLDKASSGGDAELAAGIVAFNQEKLLSKALGIKGIELRPIKTLNYYYTAESEDARTTWSKIVKHPEYGVLCKYAQQCTEAHENKKKWDAGARWSFVDGSLCIV